MARKIVLFALFFCSIKVDIASSRELLLAHVIWRHGDRSPVASIPTDTKNAPNTWGQGRLGELTAAGLQEEYILGTQLRGRYSNLGLNLSPQHIATQVYARSTDVNRTLMSAYANFAALIQPMTTNSWNATVPNITGWPSHWQPVPIHTVPTNQDIILRSHTYCPKADQLYRTNVWNSTKYTQLSRDNQNFFRWLAVKAGILDINLDNMWMLHDPLSIEKLHNRTWPSWVNGAVFNQIQMLSQYSDSQLFHYITIARLRGGPLLSDIVQRMQWKRACMGSTSKNCTWINNLKYIGYSGHDTTLMPLLETLARDDVGSNTGATSLTGGGLPHLAACITIDLFLEDDGKSVTVEANYKNYFMDTAFAPIPVSGTGNMCKSGKCPLNAFVSRSIPFMPVNYVQECSLSSIAQASMYNEINIRSPWKPVKNLPDATAQKQNAAIGNVTGKRRLVMVHALWRHGDRTPVSLIPTDTNNSLNTWFQGALGELTPTGMKQEFTLGKQLGDRYQGWIDPQNVATQMYIRSTDYNRTLMSGYSNIAGMFSGLNGLMMPNISGWPSHWQPVPVHTIPRNQDYLLWWPYCKTVDWLNENVVGKSKAWTDIVTANQPFFDFLSNKTGISNVNLDQFYKISDPLHFENADKAHHQWPNWVTPAIYQKIVSIKKMSDQFYSHHPEIARIKGGPLLGEIISRMKNIIKCIESPPNSGCDRLLKLKYYAYSAHDLTVMAFLEVLARNNVGNMTGATALTGGGFPHTASVATVDLFQEVDSSFTVEIHFKNDWQYTKFVPVPVNGGCETGKCSFRTFQQRSIPFIPFSREYECNRVPSTQMPSSASGSPTTQLLTKRSTQTNNGKTGIKNSNIFLLFLVIAIGRMR